MNFAFLLMKTMRFYGWSWKDTMETPISAFWTCYRYVDRLRAQEMLDRFPEHGIEMADRNSREELIRALKEQIGTVVVEKPVFDREGWRSLQKLSQK